MRTLSGLSIPAFAFGVFPSLFGQQTPTASDRVYTDAQAARGRAIYQEKCTRCHGEMLEGRSAPPLTGTAFLGVWGAQPLSELASKIRNTMPAQDPGKLKPAEAADLVAYILQAGKFPSGQKELGADEAALKTIVLAPSQAKPQVAADATSQGPQFPAFGNLAQVMRGILFPSSNIIFNVQLHDPAEPAKPLPPGSFSWSEWGDTIYSRWQMVDYAAVAIVESAPLMLTPGRRCENGRPVPVDRSDWIKFSQELAEAGRAAYKASQTRSQDAVSEATNQLSDACFHCHSVYRDKRGRPGDPNSAAKCTP